MSKKSSLGRGLAVLIPDLSQDITDTNEDDQIVEIKLGDIKKNKYQPRLEFKEEKISELAQSIEENGMIQPIVVSKENNFYYIVAGERRYRAVKKLGWDKIPAIIRDISKKDAAHLALIENIQREDLNVVEEALAYKAILEEFKITQSQLAKQLGKSRPYISNTIRLLDLQEDSLEALIKELISTGHAKLLLALKDDKLEKIVLDEVIKKSLTVRETEKLIGQLRTQDNQKQVKNKIEKDSYIKSLEEDLMRSLGTKVNLLPGKKKSVIEIEYYSEEDLERILSILS